MNEMTEPQQRATKTVGVIDIGSNSVRLEIAEVYPDGHFEVLERARLPARLGQDTFVDRSLSRRTMNATISILRGYMKMIETYQVEELRAVATSAVREAANADAFLDRIFIALGLEVEVIEPVEESRLIVSAVRESIGSEALSKGCSLVSEVGGGSAMLALLEDGEIVNSGSYALGAIRLQEALDTSGERPDRAVDMLRHQIGSVVAAMSKTLPLKQVRTFVAVGGDARFAADQVGPGHTGNDRAISRETFDQLINDCQGHTPDDLARKYKLPFAEAETVVPALLVYQAIMQETRAKTLLVSEVSMRDGVLHDLALRATGRGQEEEATSAIRSAQTIAEKYHCDMNHAGHVATLSLQLFDELRNEHGLASRYRLLLNVAAVLHEVGGYINGRAHHKHSYYIISNTPVFGLRADEQDVVANVARYHRRSAPRQSHLPYMSLPRERRVAVSKLAAILRVADALERGHNQAVWEFDVERVDDEIVLHVHGVNDLALERRALASKGDLFEDTYGLRLRLDES
ncbi:MAG: HD domain-containing protein [Phycisphaerae bacterium]|nr:HD domain-containing protein [Phycisphaerae bacterium]